VQKREHLRAQQRRSQDLVSAADHGLVAARRMATSGPITYLVMEDQFPSVAVPGERLPHGTGMPGLLIGYE
jgi:hypothetical protein